MVLARPSFSADSHAANFVVGAAMRPLRGAIYRHRFGGFILAGSLLGSGWLGVAIPSMDRAIAFQNWESSRTR
jgi:hypothetical protein